MSAPPAPTNDPIDAFEQPAMLGGEFVLGYPATEPSSIDLGPAPSGAGAKPSAKSVPIEHAGKPKPKPKSASKPSQAPEPRSGPPLPKQPKGRLFIGSVFASVLIGLGFSAFNALLRYTAYGEVVGRRIDLAVPWPGVIQSVHVREGDLVNHGELIARIDSLELRQKIEQIDDSLRLERAQLASDLAMLRWEAEKIRDIRKLSQSEFYDKWSELLWEQSKLADLRMQLKRLEPIVREGAVSEEKADSLRYQFAGQEKRVEQLTEAVRALKQRSDESPIELDLEDRVKPTLARIENLQAELVRTRQIVQQGEIRAPAAGRIVRTHRFAGEYADPTVPVAELLVEGSTELVLYIPQSDAKSFPVGKTVTINVNPTNSDISCEVLRVALEMRKAPDSLARYYRADETLLPVYLRVTDQKSSPSWLTLGSELRLPRTENLASFTQVRRWWNGTPTSESQQALPHPESSEPLLPVRTASGKESELEKADNHKTQVDGRTAGWVRPSGSGSHPRL